MLKKKAIQARYFFMKKKNIDLLREKSRKSVQGLSFVVKITWRKD